MTASQYAAGYGRAFKDTCSSEAVRDTYGEAGVETIEQAEALPILQFKYVILMDTYDFGMYFSFSAAIILGT